MASSFVRYTKKFHLQIQLKQKIDKYLGYLLIGICLPFTRLLGISLRRSHSIKNAPSRILFLKLMGLGSLVLATDAIIAIRQRFPTARLILITDSNIAAGIAPFHLFDEIWETNTDNFFHSCLRMVGFIAKTWTWRKTWVVDLEVYSKLTTVFALLTLARNRFGFYLSLVPFRKYLNTHNIPFSQTAFLEDNYGQMAKHITGFTKLSQPVIVKRLQEHKKPYIIINNTCSSLAIVRKLPTSILLEVSQWVLKNTDYGIAFLGAATDKNEIECFIKTDPFLLKHANRIINFTGTGQNFNAYYSFIQEKGVCLLTIDSAPLHIAKKLGLPTLSIWGPTNPDNYLKVNLHEQQRHLTYYLKSHCSPCIHRHELLPCGGNNSCMKKMDATIIIKKLQILLAHLAVSNTSLRSV